MAAKRSLHALEKRNTSAARHTSLWLLVSTLGAFPATDAFAQSSTNVAMVAVDAFGERVGSEQIGLYTETQVRGFSLQESGNYRLDGAYFIRSANIVPVTLDGTTIRVGINALGVEFPAPSGIVDYRLSPAPPGLQGQTEIALRDYGGRMGMVRGSAATADGALGAAYAVSIMEELGSDGQERHPRWYAFVPTWRPNDKFQLRAMLSGDSFSRDGGEYGVVAEGTVLPPPQPNPGKYYVDWGQTQQWQYAGGLIARFTPTDRLALQSSFVVTELDRWRSDFTRLTLGADGTGTASVVRGGPVWARSMAGETRAHWQLSDTQQLFGTVRWRQSNNRITPGVSAPLGFVDQNVGILPTPELAPSTLRPTTDETRQVTAGVGYETDLTSSLWFRGAVLKTQYERDVAPPNLPVQSNSESPWLYDVAARFAATDKLTLFATSVRGLEESGIAPNNASNRNEVLPAAIATQYELGLRYQVTPAITFISSLFEISKPTPGFDAQNVYRLIGEARHRGIEFSLVGRPTPSINILSGLVLLDPAREGELVDQGVLIGRAPGVASATALLNVTYQVPALRGLSIDSQVTYNSRMLVNPRNGLYTPGYAVYDLGARYVFEVRGVSATLRARVGNVLDEDQWFANRNETIGRVPRRAFRLSLTTEFGS